MQTSKITIRCRGNAASIKVVLNPKIKSKLMTAHETYFCSACNCRPIRLRLCKHTVPRIVAMYGTVKCQSDSTVGKRASLASILVAQSIKDAVVISHVTSRHAKEWSVCTNSKCEWILIFEKKHELVIEVSNASQKIIFWKIWEVFRSNLRIFSENSYHIGVST